MNDIIREITKLNINNIKSSFAISKKLFSGQEDGSLFHAGEFGSYRESLVKNLLRLYIPEKYGISSGFVITSTNKISTQCDIVIYHKDCTPVIDNNNQRFFPVESVVGVGEVKSDIQSAKSLNEILRKLARVKALRLELEKTNPEVYERKFETSIQRMLELYPGAVLPPEGDAANNYKKIAFRGNGYDNIYTFLICNRFAFDYSTFHFDYQEIEPHFWHNTILSLEDGLFTYITEGGTPNLSFPTAGKQVNRHYFTKATEEQLPPYIRTFLTKLHEGIVNTTVFNFDILGYLSPDHDIIRDQIK